MAAKDNLDILIIGGSGFVSGTMVRIALASGLAMPATPLVEGLRKHVESMPG